MAHRGPVLKTEGNFNNHVGVPLTLLRIGAEHASAVVEMGTSSPGELAPLSKAVAPSCAVLTNIGHEHMEFFHTLEAVRNEEITVTEGLRRGGTLVLNADDPYLQKVRTNARFKVRTFGITRGQVRPVDLTYDARGCGSFRIGRTWFRLQVPGAHNVLNALAAISVGLVHRIPKSDMADRLSAFRAVEGRMNVLDAQAGFRVIDDCYNANPSSVRSALQILSGMQTSGRRIAVLGDMLELGEQTVELHRGIGAWAAEMAVDQLWCVGPLAANIAEAALAAGLTPTRVHHTLDKTELESALAQTVAEGDVVLVKASHGLHLETTVRKLVALAPAALSGDLS
jgi:UDP-N-acetylmuramoyl-tripeptide--D-alanyl-D-alanine ligase